MTVVDITRRRDDVVSFLRTARVSLTMNSFVSFHPYSFAFVLTACKLLAHTIVVRVWLISVCLETKESDRMVINDRPNTKLDKSHLCLLQRDIIGDWLFISNSMFIN